MNIKKPYCWIIVSILSCLGCNAPSQFEVSQVPSRAFKTFGQAEVRLFTVEMARYSATEPDIQKQIQESPPNLQSQIAKKMAKRKVLQDGIGERVVISGKIGDYDTGDRTARWLFGFGAGEGKITAIVSFVDGQGNLVARGTAIGRVQFGFAGGSMDSAVEQLADAIVSFIESNINAIKK